MDIAREILEKHLSKDLDIQWYLRTSPLTYQVVLDAIEEAINYTHCCKELKDKYVPNFEEWKLINKYTQRGSYIYDENGENYMNSDLKEKYINEILNL